MSGDQSSRRMPVSEAHLLLGKELRRVRQGAGKTTRDVAGYSSGHISNVENGHVMPSRELVNVYLRFGGDAAKVLRSYEDVRLQGEQRARDRRQREAQDAVKITPDSPFEDIRAAYQIIEAEDLYVLNGSGVATTVTSLLRVRATHTDVRYVVGSYGYATDRRTGVISIDADVGCSVARTEEHETGVIDFVLELSREIEPSESDPFTLSFVAHTDTDKSIEPFLRSNTYAPLLRHALRVQFAPPALPTAIWWFRGAHHMETHMNQDRLLKLSPAGFYFRDFYELRDEYWGLAWRWDVP